jgi:hypothetical protein
MIYHTVRINEEEDARRETGRGIESRWKLPDRMAMQSSVALLPCQMSNGEDSIWIMRNEERRPDDEQRRLLSINNEQVVTQ